MEIVDVALPINIYKQINIGKQYTGSIIEGSPKP